LSRTERLVTGAWPGDPGVPLAHGIGFGLPTLDIAHPRTRIPVSLAQELLDLEEAVLRDPSLGLHAAAVYRQDGSGQLWTVCLHLVRDLELPLDVCSELLTGTGGYNERCVPPWTHAEIAHKLTDARDKSDRKPGAIVLAGFMENAARLGAEAAEARRAAAPVHEYTFDPANVVRKLLFVESEDGSKKVKKPHKPDIDELVFDLNTEADWTGVFRYNEFDDKIYALRPPFRMGAETGAARLPDRDLTGLRVWFLNKKGASARAEDINSAVDLIAHRNAYHPIRNWLRAMPAPSTRHLDNLASVLFGDDRAIAQVYVRRALIAAVARAMDPGCQVDNVLALAAVPRTRKSAPNRTDFPGAAARPVVSLRRQKHQVGRFVGVFEERLARRAQLRAHR
jgi:Virulence-associated protein E